MSKIDMIRDSVGLGGCALISGGVWQLNDSAGIIVAGVLLIAAAVLGGRS